MMRRKRYRRGKKKRPEASNEPGEEMRDSQKRREGKGIIGLGGNSF